MKAGTPTWAAGIEAPPWLALRQGSRPLVVVAPHGGRRLRPVQRGDRVNDLHTAELAFELAERLDAHAIVNHALDRNEADLNRISELVTRAPEVLALLHAAVVAAGESGETPLVLLVHGWNMVVPCCDIGVGLRRRDGRLAGRWPTLSAARLGREIAAIERELAARGLAADLGRRYTASGRDNAAQLFSGRHAGHEDALVDALGRLALAGRVDAAQLELGIPLRWPGPAREALLDGLVAALSAVQGEAGGVEAGCVASTSDVGAASRASARFQAHGTVEAGGAAVRVAAPAPREDWRGLLDDGAPEAGHDDAEPGIALQAVLDADGRAAAFCGVDSVGGRGMAARFCVVCTDGSMLLLVGEGARSGQAGAWDLEGMQWRWSDDGSGSIRVDGAVVRYATHDAYLDLESGLAGAALLHARAELAYEPQAPGYGRLRGELHAGDLRLSIDTTAFVERARERAGEAADRVRLSVVKQDGVVLRATSERDGGLAFDQARGLVTADARMDGLLGGEVLARVPVWRPLGAGAFARWTFGVARCRFHGTPVPAAGLFDSLEVFRPGR